MMRAQASSMQQFLDGLERGYGGATGWARATGVDEATLTRLRDLLVED
jgi:hypothetical protein